MSFDVKVSSNFKEREIQIAGKRAMGKSVFDIGLIVEANAKALAPVDLGRLRGSITTQARDKGTDVEGQAQGGDKIAKPNSDLEVLVGTAVNYAAWVEYGTGAFTLNKPVYIRKLKGWRFIKNHPGIKAQPYMRPALALARGDTLNILVRNGRAEFKDFA